MRAQTHELFLLQNKNGDRLRSLGVPVFQSVADLENQCIKQVSHPTDTLPKAIRQAPELVALDQTSPRLRWTEFASNYAVIVDAIHESCEDRILKDKQQLSTLLKRLKSIRSGGLIPTQGILLQSQVAAISPEHYSQVISHYDIFIDVVTLAINSKSAAKRNVTDELLQELNRRDPLNTLRKKREMLQLFELVRCRETREAFAL